jgi:type III restriction system methyltransferase
MMYPRLALAKDLLSDNGVIFISIDDHESANLIELCNEIIGEANFIAQLIWERAYSPKNDAKFISNSHDYVLMYSKKIDRFELGRLERTDEANARYSNPDNDSRGAWKPSDLSVKTYNASCDYIIKTPSGREVEPPAGRCWRLSKKAFLERLQDNRIWFGANGDSAPCLKRFLAELKYEGMAPTSILFYKEVGHTQEASKEVATLLDASVFDGPKPVRLLKRLLKLANTDKNSIIFDFFSGSSTTAHAVMQLNSEDGGKRQFIMVQLPEPCEKKNETLRTGYETICDIAKERIRRAGKKIKEEAGLQGQHLDIGFRVYKLDSSNLRVWNPEVDDLELALGSHEKHLLPGRTQEDLLYEILLKQGIELTEDARVRDFEGKHVYSLGHGQYYACMETVISSDQIESLALGIVQWKNEESPDNTQCAVFVIDEAFRSDADKLNFAKILEQHGIPSVKAL